MLYLISDVVSILQLCIVGADELWIVLEFLPHGHG